MDEKTEELRDIFMDVADEGTVIERQEESPGTLAEDTDLEERLSDLITRIRDRYEFQSSLDADALVEVTRGFYDDRSDATLAAELDADEQEVFRARLDLHLLKESDRDAPFDFESFRSAVLGNGELPEVDSIDEDERERYRAVVDAEQEIRKANYRFRDQFDDLLGDGDIAEHLTQDVTDDGLADATEGLEIDTAF